MDTIAGRQRGDGGAQHDAALAKAAAAGRRDALGEIFRRHADTVYRLAYRVTGSSEDAEDVLQDVFVGLPRALSRYEEQGRFLYWLRQVTARTALSLMRTRGRRRFEPLDVDALGTPSQGGDVVDRLAVARVLADMPTEQRIVFLLKEVEGYDHGEIADLLSVSRGAARARLHRAWRFLRRRLEVDS